MLGALLMSGLFVGCHDPYDDTAIVERLDDLEARVKKLESGYQGQVNVLQTLTALQQALDLLEEQVETNTGNIETNKGNIADNANEIANLLTALNELTGTSNLAIEEIQDILEQLKAKDISLQEALDALGAGILSVEYNEATGVAKITLSNGSSFEFLTGANAVDAVKAVKDTDGNLYWAVGGEFILDANGNKIPVTVTPQVKVDPTTREVSISADGGKTWYATGIIDEEVLPLFLSVESDDAYVYITLADGEKITVAKSSYACDVKFELNKLYVDYGTTETVVIGMENVAKYVIVKPEGWRVAVNEVTEEDAPEATPEVRAAVLDGKTVLSITAPAEGVGEASGLVSFFCVGADGRAAIYEVEVVAGLPTIAVAVDGNAGLFSIAIDDEKVPYTYGVAELKGDATLESVYKAATAKLTAADVHTGSLDSLSLTEALKVEALALGSKYVVWAVMVDGDEAAYKAKPIEKVASATFHKRVNISFSDTTSVDAKVKIETAPESGKYFYYIQPLGENAEKWTAEEAKQKIDAQVKSATSTSDELTDGKYEGSLLEWYKAYYMASAKLTPGQTVFVAVVPEDDKTEGAVAYGLVTLDGYKYDAESTASVTFGKPTESYTNVSVRITPASGTCFRFGYMTEKEYLNNYEGDDNALMNFAIGEGKPSGEKKTAQTASPYPLVLGESYIVVVYAYDPSTAVGKVFTQKISCPAITYNEEMSLSLNVKYTGVNYAEVEIVPTGGNLKSIRYAFMKKADFASNSTLKGDYAIAEEKLVTNLTVSNRKNFNTANLKADNLYSIENLYLMEDQILFVIGFDENDKVVHMKYEEINTTAPFNNGFDENLAKPTVKDVYYIAKNSSGYKKPLTDWSKMSELTDVTTLNDLTGMYSLDLDWGTTEVKRMWLCNENTQNWKGDYALSEIDMKANAIAVLKKRAGYPSSSAAPDFYGLNSTTGALALTGVQVYNTSEYKALRDKSDAADIKAKTIYLVWETKDGKYGYMSVVPESFANVTEGGEEGGEEGEDPAAGDLANSPWGRTWVWQEEGMADVFAFMMLDLGKTTPNTIVISMGSPDEDMENMIFMKQQTYTCSGTPVVKTSNGETYLSWEDAMGEEYRVYFSNLEWTDPSDKSQGGYATIWSPTTAAHEGVNLEAKKDMMTYEAIGLPPFTYVDGIAGM